MYEITEDTAAIIAQLQATSNMTNGLICVLIGVLIACTACMILAVKLK